MTPRTRAPKRTQSEGEDREESAGVTATREWPVVAALTLVGAVLTWFRVPPGGHQTLYAEDGREFIQDWMTDSAPWFKAYAGYQHFIPRAASWVVTSFTPIGWWAVAITIAACLLTGLVCGLVYLFSRDVLDVPVCRFGWRSSLHLFPSPGWKRQATSPTFTGISSTWSLGCYLRHHARLAAP